MTLGEKLVILRKKNSLSQDELASAIRVSRQSVYKWESGKSAPDANNLIALKATFGISIDNLLDENYVEQMPERKKKTRISAEEKARIRARVLAEEGAQPEENERAEDYVPITEDIACQPVSEESSDNTKNCEKEQLGKKEEPSVEVKTEEKEDVEKPESSDKKIGFFGRLFGKK